MPDYFLVRQRKDGWEVVRVTTGPARRSSIVRGIRTWTEVQSVLDEAAATLGGFAWPEERHPHTDIFSLRTEPEPQHFKD